jgi:diguanylate cyclase (GGDEF)-like protein/PAS domain S-box-containing protein
VSDRRSRAEERLKSEGAPTQTGTPSESDAALHELRVHQVELEMQNEELRRAQLEVEEARSRYFELFDNAPVGYLTLDDEGLIDDANLTAATTLGVPISALVGQPFTRFVAADDQDVFYLRHKALVRTGRPQGFELRLPGAGGGVLWMHAEAVLAGAGPDGDPACRLTLTDITEYKLDADARIEGRALLQAIVNGTTDAVYVKDAQGRYLLFNPAAEDVTGKRAADVLGKDDHALFPPDEAETIMAADRRAIEGTMTFEETVTGASGESVTFLSTKGPFHDERGELLGLFGIARDITKRKRAEAALAESERNFRNFFDTVDDIIVVAAPDGRLVYGNPATSTRLGYGAEEFLTLHVLDLHPPGRRDEAETIIGELLRDERDSCPFPLQTRAGELVAVETRAWLGRWDGAECIFGVCKDLTREQEALQRFDRLFHGSPALMTVNSVPEGRFTDVNEAYLAAFGYSREEVLGRTAVDLGLFADPQEYAVVAQALELCGRVTNHELKVRRHDGTLLDGLLFAELIESQGSQHVLTVMIDQTERKRAEEQLRVSEERLARAVEGSGVGLWDWQVQGGEVVLNERWAEIIGYTLAELQPVSIETWRGLCHPDDLQRSDVLVEEHFAGQSPTYRFEARMRHKDGHWVWVLDRGKVSEWDDDGRPLRMVGTHLDISSRRAAEAEIAGALSVLESTLESTADGILVADGAGGITRLNRRFLEIWSIPDAIAATHDDEAALGYVLDQLVEPEEFLKTVHELYADPEQTSFDVLKLKGGRVLERYSQPQRIGDSVVGRVWSFRDVTERVRAEGALQLQSRLQRLLMDMSARYIDLPLAAVDATIDDSLRELGEFVEADRVYVFDYDFERQTYSNTYEWCAAGIEPQIDSLQGLPLASLPDWIEAHRRGVPTYVPDVLALPQNGLREVLEPQSIKSLLGIPLMSAGECLGFVGFDSVRRHREYADDERLLLTLFARMLGSIRQRQGAEEALRRSEQQYRLLADHMTDLVWLMDMDMSTTYQSPSSEKVRGYSSDELRVLPMEKNLTPASLELAMRAFREHLPRIAADPSYDPVVMLELEYYRKDGSTFWSENTFSVIRDAEGRPVSILGEGRDVTERKRAQEQIEEQNAELLRLNDELVAETTALAEANATITRIAATDVLTGLANRRSFYASLEQAVSLARRHGTSLALISLDLDGLKRVNDTLGHAAGDEVLVSFAALVFAQCRAEDVPARLGGDEFSVLLPATDLEGARELAERVLVGVRCSAQLKERAVTVSIGIAPLLPEELPEALLGRADEALYAAKGAGGDSATIAG